jgi:hypothetical protein
MNEVKTTVPKGYEVNERLSTADCVVFNKINEREWIDGGKISGYYIDAYCSIKNFDAKGNRDIMDKSVFAEEAQAEGAVALAVYNIRYRYDNHPIIHLLSKLTSFLF